MKRAGNLLKKIASFENLQLAFYKAQRGKQSKEEVFLYTQNLHANLKILQGQLLTGNIDVGNYHYFTIYDPKERLICAASFPERVLHHALMNVCHAYFEKHLIADTYATRLNKGTYKALDKAKYFHKNHQYHLKCDIRKYFASIEHQILRKMLARMFKDKELLLIFDKIIYSYQQEEVKGLPIGNLTSQYFANMYLGYLDNYIKHELKAKAYLRYMDDFVIWHNDKVALNKIKQAIVEFTKEELNLDFKILTLNQSICGLTFLSYRIFPNKILLSRRAKNRFSKKMNAYTFLLENGSWGQEEFARHTRAITSFSQYAYAKGFRKNVARLSKAVLNTIEC